MSKSFQFSVRIGKSSGLDSEARFEGGEHEKGKEIFGMPSFSASQPRKKSVSCHFSCSTDFRKIPIDGFLVFASLK